MKVLLVSDTHRRTENLKNLIKQAGPFDAIFHMGDSEQSMEFMESLADCPVYMVAGNCDFNSSLPKEQVVDMGGHRFFITHGHKYFVDFSLDDLKNAAKERGADIACFGHTHRAVVDYEGQVIAVNPGSLTSPRPYGSRPTYILMEIDGGGEVHFTVNEC